jgi:hypothetical protein
LRRIVQCSGIAEELADVVLEGMTATTPCGLGYPSDTRESDYYLGERMTRSEIVAIGKKMQECGVEPENTRVRKVVENSGVVYEILQASSETDEIIFMTGDMLDGSNVRIVRGDHAAEMSAICEQ